MLNDSKPEKSQEGSDAQLWFLDAESNDVKTDVSDFCLHAFLNASLDKISNVSKEGNITDDMILDMQESQNDEFYPGM